MVITANLKISSIQASIIVPYEVDTDRDGNIMPLDIYKNYFIGWQKNNWQQPKNSNIQLKIYTRTTITQLGMWKGKYQHNNKQKIANSL